MAKKKKKKNSDQCQTNLLRRKLNYLKELWYLAFVVPWSKESQRLVGSWRITWEGLHWENLGKKQWSKNDSDSKILN